MKSLTKSKYNRLSKINKFLDWLNMYKVDPIRPAKQSMINKIEELWKITNPKKIKT